VENQEQLQIAGSLEPVSEDFFQTPSTGCGESTLMRMAEERPEAAEPQEPELGLGPALVNLDRTVPMPLLQERKSETNAPAAISPVAESQAEKAVLAKTLLQQRTTTLALSREFAQLHVENDVKQAQELVTRFAQEAVRGCACQYVNHEGCIAAHYLIDEKLEHFSVVPNGAHDLAVCCPLAKVQDIVSFANAGDTMFPPDVTSILDYASTEFLVMVAFDCQNSLPSKLCLVLESCEKRDAFVNALTMLVDGLREKIDGSSQVVTGFEASDQLGPVISARFFLRDLGVSALQSVSRPTLWKTISEVAPYLATLGYMAVDDAHWHSSAITNADDHPWLGFRVAQHFKAAGHTWYIVESSLEFDESSPHSRIDWLAPRRLDQLRQQLHDIIKNSLGEQSYAKYFQSARFASRGGLPGTTANLHRWFAALASCINSKALRPSVVAVTLRFLEAPSSLDRGQSFGSRGVSQSLSRRF
jgi:hypothetical protein